MQKLVLKYFFHLLPMHFMTSFCILDITESFFHYHQLGDKFPSDSSRHHILGLCLDEPHYWIEYGRIVVGMAVLTRFRNFSYNSGLNLIRN